MVDRFKYCCSTALFGGERSSLRSTQIDPLGSSEDSQYFDQDYFDGRAIVSLSLTAKYKICDNFML